MTLCSSYYGIIYYLTKYLSKKILTQRSGRSSHIWRQINPLGQTVFCNNKSYGNWWKFWTFVGGKRPNQLRVKVVLYCTRLTQHFDRNFHRLMQIMIWGLKVFRVSWKKNENMHTVPIQVFGIFQRIVVNSEFLDRECYWAN